MKYKSYKKDVDKKLKTAIRGALEVVGVQAQRNTTLKIKSNKQVETGRMRASVTYVVDNIIGRLFADNKGVIHNEDKPKGKLKYNKLHIGTNVEYAPKQEMINPFLKPSIINNKEQYKTIFMREVKRIMEGK